MTVQDFMEQQSENNEHPITTLVGCIDLLHAALQQAAGLVELDGFTVSESFVCREAIKWLERLSVASGEVVETCNSDE